MKNRKKKSQILRLKYFNVWAAIFNSIVSPTQLEIEKNQCTANWGQDHPVCFNLVDLTEQTEFIWENFSADLHILCWETDVTRRHSCLRTCEMLEVWNNQDSSWNSRSRHCRHGEDNSRDRHTGDELNTNTVPTAWLNPDSCMTTIWSILRDNTGVALEQFSVL